MSEDDVLPTLIVAGGHIVVAETGEALAEEDAGRLLSDTLKTYANAQAAVTALSLRTEERRRRAAEDALANDWEYQEDCAGLAEARQTSLCIEATLGAMFADRDDKVSIDTSVAKVTWSVGRETWSLRNPASWYAGREAICHLLGWLSSQDYQLTEHALTDVQQEFVALAVIAWLAPTCKVGDPPAPKITLRPPK